MSAGAYSGSVTVTMFGLPSGVSVVPLSLNGSGTGTVVLNASPSAGQEGFSPIYDGSQTSWTAPVSLTAVAGSARATTQLQVTVSISNPAFRPAASDIDLPVFSINTNGVPVVTKADNIPGTIRVTSADGQTSYFPNASSTDATANFHIHGNSTAVMPKQPYHVKLNTSTDLLSAMGLVCGYVNKSGPTCDKSKSYVLLANYDDKTFLRTWSAGTLARDIPIGNGYLNSPAGSPTPSGNGTLVEWAPHGLFVELFLNGVYEGNYLLTEEIKLDSHKININELSETDTAPADVTGGYLLEIDNRLEEPYLFKSPAGLNVGLVDPDFSPDPAVPQQTSYITSYLAAAETALYSPNSSDPSTGWRAWFDEASAVNYYLVNELMGGVDSGVFNDSVYFYKSANNPLFYMGPVWDFDVSAGNVNYAPIISPVAPWMKQYAWYYEWFQDPGFAADAAQQWNALKTNGVFAAWMAKIRAQAAALARSQANNFARWPVLGLETWPNPEVAGSYQGELSYFVNWLNLRFGWMDSQFNQKAATTVSLNVQPGASGAGSPALLSAHVTGGTNPAGVVTFLSNDVVVGAAPLNAGASSLSVSLPSGLNTIQAAYNGDSANALALSAASQITVAPPLVSTVINLAGPFAGDAGALNFLATVIADSEGAAPSGTITFTVDSGPGVPVTIPSGGQASFSVAAPSPGNHTIAAQYSGGNGYLASGSAAQQFSGSVVTVLPDGTGVPVLAGVVNAAAEGQLAPEVIAPGSYVAIYGSNLAGGGDPAAAQLPLPTNLNDAQVLLNNAPIPLIYAGGTQINALIPEGLSPGNSYSLVVLVAGKGRSAPFPVMITPLQPGIYTADGSGQGAGVVTNASTGALVTSDHPAHVGDYLTVYCTGLGPLQASDGQTPPADGDAAPVSPLFQTVAPITATINGVNAPVLFAGLTPTLAGLYQVNLQVPAGVASGLVNQLAITAFDLQGQNPLLSNAVAVNIQ